MAFPSNSVTTLQSKWDAIKSAAGSIKDRALLIINASSVSRVQALNMANVLADNLAVLDAKTANASTNGLLAYARAQDNDPSIDIQTDYTTMRAQIVATQDWLVTNFPQTTGEIRLYTFDATTKKPIDIALTSGQLTSFKTQLNALVATIA